MKNNLECESYYICIYAEGDKEKFILSHNPKLTLLYLNDLFGINEIRFLKPGLRLGEAYFLLDKLREKFGDVIIYDESSNSSFYNKLKLLTRIIKDKFKKSMNVQENIEEYTSCELQKINSYMGVQNLQFSINRLNILDGFEGLFFLKPTEKEIENIITILEGRKLYLWEIYQGINELGVNINGTLIDILHWLYLQNRLELKPSISYSDDNKLKCQRCGQNDKIHSMDCQVCGGLCNYCENCVSMGEARSCRPIYHWKGFQEEFVYHKAIRREKLIDENTRKASIVNVFDNDDKIALTKAQQDAYNELTEFVEGNLEKALLIAVCGAGKSEIVFGAIQRALAKGQKVLFAIPRKDVVLELYPRLNKYFSSYNLLPLYGGCPKKYAQSSLVIATTHQTLRFKEAFDLIILDEVDAFPYKGSEMLYFAVERAKKKSGKIIYMTATPDKGLLSQSQAKDWKKITISARYHGHPLPVPEIIIESNREKKGSMQGNNLIKKDETISTTIWEIIKTSVLDERVQLFIFVPSINLAERIGNIIAKEIEGKGIGPKEWVQFSHSKDSDREIKRQGFSRGDFPIFITTTIMERGITVPKSNVLVLYAHWEKIFDQGTLIQMAGRAGRSKDYPKGRVIFFGEKITDDMKEARKIIVSLNNQAITKGYINMGEIKTGE